MGKQQKKINRKLCVYNGIWLILYSLYFALGGMLNLTFVFNTKKKKEKNSRLEIKEASFGIAFPCDLAPWTHFSCVK